MTAPIEVTICPGPNGEPPNRVVNYVDADTGALIERVAFFADPEQRDGRPYTPERRS